MNQDLLNLIKSKIMWIVALIGAVLLLLSQTGLYSHNTVVQGQPIGSAKAPANQTESTNPNEVSLVSTDPSPLDEVVISPDQPIKLTFNTPIDNLAEFKHRFDPDVAHNLSLSEDKKTVTITPKTLFNLSYTYTLFLDPEAKFSDGKTLGKEIIFHFKTVEYNGV